MRSIAFVLAATCVTGCTLFLSVDGFSGGADALDGGDAAAIGEAAVDIAVAPADSGGDVSVDARAPFCPQAGALLCADFDDDASAVVPGPWSTSSIAPGARVERSTVRSVSPPGSLVMQTTGSASFAGLARVFSGKKATLSFQLYIESRGTNLAVAAIGIDGDTTLYFQPISDAHSTLTEAFPNGGMVTYVGTDGNALPQGKWLHVDLTIDMSALAATVTVDGAVLIQRTLVAPSWSSATGQSAGIGIPNSASTIYFDDVTLRTN